MMISANSAHCDKWRSAFTNKCNSRAISDSAFFIIEITIIQSALLFFHLLDLLLRLGLLQKYKKAPVAGVISYPQSLCLQVKPDETIAEFEIPGIGQRE